MVRARAGYCGGLAVILAALALPSTSAAQSADSTEPGVSFTLHGISGAFVASTVPMKLAPGADAPAAVASLAPELDGQAAYIGTGLRVFFQGEYLRIGGSAGAFTVDRGLTQLAHVPAGFGMRADDSWGGHFEVFAGGQLDLRPVFPYLDLVGLCDIVQTRYALHVEAQGEGTAQVDTVAFNAYAFDVGPRLGVIVPISRHLYLDLGAAAGIVGMNRFMFTAGFGAGSGARPMLARDE